MHSAMQIVRNSRILVVHVDASSYKGEYDALMLEAAAAGTLVLTNGETRYRVTFVCDVFYRLECAQLVWR